MHTKLFVKVEYCLLFLFCCSGKNVLFERSACLFDNSTTTKFVIIRFLIMLICLFMSTYY